ncbi:bifunctional helix-turn-helix transcriptional regulator/GNAT family N-acetyltransferase [Rhizobium sp. SAFR-030]|uniref:bifunctional helix-turn-helix transcriptional regulator/GNAT family N-acetyltransferase n=1 Tax=Rhizobium sp. SAFR-030 TaxID=3387277 RepID=UPI003F7D0A70
MNDPIDAIRRFNRFYTTRLGILSRGYLQSQYTLTEGRVLYEVGAQPGIAAADLFRSLMIDAAYLSRILKKFRLADLIQAEPTETDRRIQSLRLTAAGEREWQRLVELSRRQIAGTIAGLDEASTAQLVQALRIVEQRLDATEDQIATLRQPRPGDIGWVVESQARFYAETYGFDATFEGLVAEVAGRFLSGFDAARERAWIGERGGQRIGSIFIANGGNDIAKLRLLYVDPAARGTGLGKRLVAEAVDFARQAGYRQISLWTYDRLDAARGLYIKAGFRLAAEEPQTAFGQAINGQTFMLDL